MTSRQLNKIKIFLASPSDVFDERQIVRKVVDEENTNHLKHGGYEITIIGWETHSRPGKAKKHPQELINKLIDGCALFIGVFWKKFGSPTADYESGTEEEYKHASKLLDNPELPLCDIAIYFCNYPIKPFSTDLNQLAKVAHFRETIGTKDRIYHWTVSDQRQFEHDFRNHLNTWIREYIGTGKSMRLSAEPSDVGRSPSEGLSEKFKTMNKGF